MARPDNRPPHPTTGETTAATRSTAVVLTDPPGQGVDEHWSTSRNGRDHGVILSTIHLDTARIGVGPPLHQHEYPEILTILRGRAVCTLGDDRTVVAAGQTVLIPPGTPHTFRTVGPDRFESVAVHLSPEITTEKIDPDDRGTW